jgi:hypothetical protein
MLHDSIYDVKIILNLVYKEGKSDDRKTKIQLQMYILFLFIKGESQMTEKQKTTISFSCL